MEQPRPYRHFVDSSRATYNFLSLCRDAGPEQLRFAEMERLVYVKRSYTRGEVVAPGQDQTTQTLSLFAALDANAPL
jgi:hypothetical protein